MRPTQEQEKAIYFHQKNLIVTAGAGSGKTRVLVERFVELLVANPSWPLASIVAITFTEKAAREMRERVSQTIEDRLEKAIKAKHEDEATFWRNHQNALDSARIGTIHSLCTKILRANIVEAVLDPKFSVLDEVQTQLLIQEAVDLALKQMVEEKHAAIALLTAYNVRDVRQVLQKFANLSASQPILDMLHEQTVASLFRRWKMHWEEFSQDLISGIQANKAFLEACQWIDNFDPQQINQDKLWPQWEVIIEQRQTLFNSQEIESVQNALGRVKAVINLRSGKKTWWGDALDECKAVLKFIRTEVENYLDQLLPPPLEIDAEWMLLWRDAIALVTEHFQQLKTAEKTLDFDDLEYRTCELLENHPNVAARYAHSNYGEFNHVMVDEFQDTNDNQRRIVYALTGVDPENRIANAGRLFVVGDPKQSIYAFRGADVSVFSKVRRELVDTDGEALSLSKSFRSHAGLIDLFNDVFGRLLQHDLRAMADFFVDYDAMNAFRAAEAYHQKALQMLVLTKGDDETIKPTIEDGRRLEAYRIAQEIEQWVQDKKLVWDKSKRIYRPMEYRDVAILFQAMTNAHLYEKALQATNIPYMTVAGKGYFERQEVWDVMNMLAFLHRPMDDLALASVLRSPFFALSDDALLALRLRKRDDKRLSLWDALLADDDTESWFRIESEADVAAIDFARQVLLNLLKDAGRVTIAELLHNILEQTGFEATLMTLPNGRQRRANVLKLIDVAQQSNRVSLSDFSMLLRDMVNTEVREGEAVIENENVVVLMSVHKSKGLEFPAVILPDSARDMRLQQDILMVDPMLGPVCKVPDENRVDTDKTSLYQIGLDYTSQRDFAERLRLLYVAMTRAQDYLFVSGYVAKPADPKNHWLSQLWQSLELDDDTEGLQSYDYTWGNLTLKIEALNAQNMKQSQIKTQDNGFSLPDVDFAQPVATQHIFPLLEKPTFAIPGDRLHLQATDLERFGRISFEQPAHTAQQDFRQHLLEDLPNPIRPVSKARINKSRLIGTVLHYALQMQLYEQRAGEMIRILMAYMLEEGIRDDALRKEIVQKVRLQLEQFTSSPLASMLNQATSIYREIEFVLEHASYVIHGIIDLLFLSDVGWTVIDYKSGRPPYEEIERYSQRYVYQMGAYALAVEKQTGIAPKVGIQYLHYAQYEPYWIPEQRWRAAMNALDIQLSTTLKSNKG